MSARPPAAMSGAEKAPECIEMTVVGHGMRATLRMPWRDAPVACMPGLDVGMLHGATLILDQDEIERLHRDSHPAAFGTPQPEQGPRSSLSTARAARSDAVEPARRG